MVGDASLTGVAAAGEFGVSLNHPNVDTVTVPDGAVWFVGAAWADGGAPIRVSILVDGENFLPESTDLWQFTSSNAADMTALGVGDGSVFAGDADGGLYSLDAGDGSAGFNVDVVEGIDDVIYEETTASVVLTKSNAIAAYNPDDGSLLYENFPPRNVTDDIASAGDGVVYGSSMDGYVLALDPADGTLLWEAQVGGGGNYGRGIDVTSDGSTVYATYDVATAIGLYTVDTATQSPGQELALIDGEIPTCLTLGPNEDVVVVGSNQGNARFFDVETGDVVFTESVGQEAFSVVSSDEYVFIGDADGSVSAHEPTGELVYAISPTQTSIDSLAPDPAGGGVYVGSESGNSTVYYYVESPLYSGARLYSGTGELRADEYAYGGDVVSIGVHEPKFDQAYRLSIREIVSP